MKWTQSLTLMLIAIGTIACGDEEGQAGDTISQDMVRDAGLDGHTCVNHSDCQIGEVCRFGQCSMETVEAINPEEADEMGDVSPVEEMVEQHGDADGDDPLNSTPPLTDPTRSAPPMADDADAEAEETMDESACARDFDCPVGSRCADGACVDREDNGENDHGCRADVECGPNRLCIDGICVGAEDTSVPAGASGEADQGMGVNEPCAGAADCAAGQRCVDGACAAPECGAERPCADGFNCQVGTCQPAAAHPLGGGACEAPERVRIGESIVGRTPNAENLHEGGCGRATGPESVFHFMALANETVCITTSETNFDPIVYVREADCNMGQEAACNDDDRDFDIAPGVFDSALQFNTTVGTSYYIFVDGSREQAGDFQLNIVNGPCGAAAPGEPQNPPNPLDADENDADDLEAPANEVCENAPDLSANVSKRGDTRDGLANHRAACGSGFGKEEVYHYRSFIDRTVCVMTEGAEFFTTLYVQADVCGGEDRMVETLACAEHPVASRDARLEFQATGLTHYYIFVDSIQDGGTYNIKLLEGPCPEL